MISGGTSPADFTTEGDASSPPPPPLSTPMATSTSSDNVSGLECNCHSS